MIDRNSIDDEHATYLDYLCDKAIARRARHKAMNVCINGPLRAPGTPGNIHGPVVSGGKCQRCLDVHKRTA